MSGLAGNPLFQTAVFAPCFILNEASSVLDSLEELTPACILQNDAQVGGCQEDFFEPDYQSA
jgi:hypothetical protein